MKIVLTGGGTGGHIYPALAIGDKFKEYNPSCEILYIGAYGGMEERIVPAHGVDLKLVRARGINRSNPVKLFQTAWDTELGYRKALAIMKKYKPDAVISTGSFISAPVVLAARKLGIKIYIHEQNAFPGIANKKLSKFARLVFLGFEAGGTYFEDKSKLIYSGNPVRKAFYNLDRTECRKKLDIPESHFVVTVFGGSLGASTLNEIGVECATEFAGREGVTLLFGTGRNYYDSVQRKMKALRISEAKNLRVTPYIQDMPDVLGSSNVVISRSGALSAAEIMTTGRAAIFIPSPNVTGDHQYYNAKAVADQGGAIIVREDGDSCVRVVNTLNQLMREPETLDAMEEGSRKAAPLDATEIIYRNIMDDLKK
ncbi:undecaprenyldiphospho-muramoylpentapeptide beta-N-acetylglucosaminyltransferase [Clostridiales Family XIII bacterium RF-744-FAT-WT-3]|uniref:UDP-N-acetylglucosamine--N-acetylmuramyl-(pentapeptide) pyrophosphoryl-undecaprenol N-acetylglucosamine transferase n=1 Tax=Baileyella intestinalis TaxID=2606709 RepID=A0A6A8M6J8_9FIRM|nr:undecaprenyldiphospho-muramoylpentapeptide beta-N-acetylglucosaminyltransferase [Baileyella intestinalis]MST68188.1 undecaprenyldiphospho-muramoylpentapeptide beta-N-acetylglucosaminyltransferase [Baileyella intestinalis]